ncbi:MAG: SGNH/GDSL hydrolase family protein [Bacteroidales bacterium]|nr:SGNH/GDSL hydrolase family protein [Bacteroidales bacterium]
MKKLILLLTAVLTLPVFAIAQDAHYVDARTLTIINKAQVDETPFQRIDVDRYPDLTQKVHDYYRFSTGVAVVFRTDSRNITARWTTANAPSMNNTPLIAARGLDLYILRDGVWTWAGVGRPSTKGNETEAALVSNMDGETHDCLLYLPLFAEITSLEIGVDEDSTIEAIGNPFSHKIVAIGSSITHGVGVSRPGMAWPARLERRFGFQFANLGANGQCKLEEFYAKIAADTDADAFIIDGFSNPSAEQIEERLETFVRIIREAHPDTPLIFLQTEVREQCNFDQKTAKFEADKRAMAERMMGKILSEYDNVYFINPGMPVGDDHEAMCDGIHPTDLGHERILSVTAPQISAILSSNGLN